MLTWRGFTTITQPPWTVPVTVITSGTRHHILGGCRSVIISTVANGFIIICAISGLIIIICSTFTFRLEAHMQLSVPLASCMRLGELQPARFLSGHGKRELELIRKMVGTHPVHRDATIIRISCAHGRQHNGELGHVRIAAH